MNLSEGTRRLALVLGGLGAIAGGVLSYVYLQPILHHRDLHNSFERFANSDVVKEQRKILQSPDPFASIAKPIPPPPSGYAVDAKTGERIEGLPAGAVLKPIPPPPSGYTIDPKTGEPQLDPSSGEPMLDWSTSIPIPSQVNKGGIMTINWGENYAVASIETADGETLSPTPAPAGWQYLLGALFPFLGFLIPWGAVRSIGWVLAGFVQPSK